MLVRYPATSPEAVPTYFVPVHFWRRLSVPERIAYSANLLPPEHLRHVCYRLGPGGERRCKGGIAVVDVDAQESRRFRPTGTGVERQGCWKSPILASAWPIDPSSTSPTKESRTALK